MSIAFICIPWLRPARGLRIMFHLVSFLCLGGLTYLYNQSGQITFAALLGTLSACSLLIGLLWISGETQANYVRPLTGGLPLLVTGVTLLFTSPAHTGLTRLPLTLQIALGVLLILAGIVPIAGFISPRVEVPMLRKSRFYSIPFAALAAAYWASPNASLPALTFTLLAVCWLFSPELTSVEVNTANLGTRERLILSTGGAIFTVLLLLFSITFTFHSGGNPLAASIQPYRVAFFATWIAIQTAWAVLSYLLAGYLGTTFATIKTLVGVTEGAGGFEMQNLLRSLDVHINQVKTRNRTLENELVVQQTTEKNLQTQLNLLSNLSHQLETLLDPPVSAQIVAATLQRTTHCDLVCVLSNQAEDQRLAPVALVGPDASLVPVGFRLNPQKGLISQAIRHQKTVLRSHPQGANSGFRLGECVYYSEAVVPLIRNGFLEGIILLLSQRQGFFQPRDISLFETAGTHLISAWERSATSEKLAELIKSSSSLGSLQDLDSVFSQMGTICQRILQAHLVQVAISRPEGWKISVSGKNNLLPPSFKPGQSSLVREIMRSAYTLRIRDIRRDNRCLELKSDWSEPCSLLAAPIRLHGVAVGVIMALGKSGALTFQDQDEFLIELIASQTASALESSVLNTELRSNLQSTQLLHDLSMLIARADELETAARSIVETAYHLSQAAQGGMVLFTTNHQIEAEVYLPEKGLGQRIQPFNLIEQSMQSHQVIFVSVGDNATRVCFPLETPRRMYGALWLEIANRSDTRSRLAEELRLLVNSAAVALERSVLLNETRNQANQLADAYHKLAITYDQTLISLMSALDARDRETEGHSIQVANLAISLGKKMNLSPADLKALERGALLHDIGKIGISDTILNKPGQLNDQEWAIMVLHPEIGARIVENVPFLGDAMDVIACHHERWNGSGYPRGLIGVDIPLLARIFAVADVFDALTRDRPYHARIPINEAIEYIQSQSGILFDPDVVSKLTEIREVAEPVSVRIQN